MVGMEVGEQDGVDAFRADCRRRAGCRRACRASAPWYCRRQYRSAPAPRRPRAGTRLPQSPPAPPAFLPASRSASARSTPITTSSEVESTPSLIAVTAISPIFLRVAVMADSAPALKRLRAGHDLDQFRELARVERRRQELELDGVLHALVEARDRRGLQALLGDKVFEHQPDRRLRQSGNAM